MNLFTKTETDSQTENKLMVIKGEMEEVGYIGSMGLTDVHYYIKNN